MFLLYIFVTSYQLINFGRVISGRCIKYLEGECFEIGSNVEQIIKIEPYWSVQKCPIRYWGGGEEGGGGEICNRSCYVQ